MTGAGLTIGKVAARSGVGAKAIRFYEAVGVIPPPARAESGYRLYSSEAIDLLRFIRQAQGLGLTLDEIREIVMIRRGGRPPCRHVHRLLVEKAAELDQKLNDLLTLRRRIRQSLTAWARQRTGKAAVCPHIEAPTAPTRRPSAGRPAVTKGRGADRAREAGQGTMSRDWRGSHGAD